MAEGYTHGLITPVQGDVSIVGNLNVSGQINATGVDYANQQRTSSSYVVNGENAGGGYIRLDRSGVQAPTTATQIKLYARQGTTGCKLVAISASGAEYIILDNIV